MSDNVEKTDNENGNAQSGEKREKPVVWPQDMNAPRDGEPSWGSDPEALRNG